MTWHRSGNNRIYWVGMFEARSVSVKNEHTHTHTHSLIPPWGDQCEWHIMTRMTGPDCAVKCNFASGIE